MSAIRNHGGHGDGARRTICDFVRPLRLEVKDEFTVVADTKTEFASETCVMSFTDYAQ